MTQTIDTEIKEAIRAHGAWKMRLRSAVQTQERDLPVDAICSDSACRFGKWLSEIAGKHTGDAHYETVRVLHKEFHHHAGDIAKMIRDGQDDRARTALADSGQFLAKSSELTRALSSWRRSL